MEIAVKSSRSISWNSMRDKVGAVSNFFIAHVIHIIQTKNISENFMVHIAKLYIGCKWSNKGVSSYHKRNCAASSHAAFKVDRIAIHSLFFNRLHCIVWGLYNKFFACIFTYNHSRSQQISKIFLYFSIISPKWIVSVQTAYFRYRIMSLCMILSLF